MDCDSVAVMEGGRTVEQGCPGMLLCDETSILAGMHRAQTKGQL